MSPLDDAIKLAVDAHAGQFDKGGKPYIFHPLRVMQSLRTESEQIVGVLHDVVEDSEVSLEDISRRFGDEVAKAVDAITKRDGEAYEQYLLRVARNPIARAVKMADLSENMDANRLGREPTQADRSRIAKYQEAAGYLFAYRPEPQDTDA